MSFWTHVFGSISVSVPGRTQAEIQYILDTVLDHLPIVSGSEGEMKVQAVRKDGHNMSSSCDEFGMRTNNLMSDYGYKTRRYGFLQTQDQYTLVINTGLRDRMFGQTKREFLKWLVRLSKRLWVNDILVSITSDDGGSMLINGADKFYNLHESASWYRDTDGEPCWWEYLMWKRHPLYMEPLEHVYKYYSDEATDREMARRKQWEEDLENQDDS